MIKKNEYIALRNGYIPEKLRDIFILESPPLGYGYFYNPEGRITEVLFRAFMRLICFTPKTKEEGLKQFAHLDYILINAIYMPVNKVPDKEAGVDFRQLSKFFDRFKLSYF